MKKKRGNLLQLQKDLPKKTVLVTLFCFFVYHGFGNSIYAKNKIADLKTMQEGTITGTVVDAGGVPMIGVNVVEKGTSNGTTTDFDGNFSLKVNKSPAVLVFSYIGFSTIEKEVTDNQPISITLEEDASKLDEVVVVGYGTMKKKDLTGSVVQIRPDKMANENPKTVQDILRGAPGLRIGYNASAKGGGNIQIRGQRSVYDDGGHNNPLLILDGMIFYGELSEINPDDIEQIDVLKDASAAAIYGSKAASGVIIINTKKGKQGKPVVNVTTNTGMTRVSNYRERFSTDAYLQHRQDWYTKNTYGVNPETGGYEAYQTGVYADQPGFFMRPDQLPSTVSVEDWRGYTTNENGESDLSIWAKRLGFQGNALQNLLAGKTVDWRKHTFRTGFDQDFNASVSGATEKTNYYLSMGYLKNEGAVVNDEYRAIRANMKVDTRVADWFEIGANVNFQDRSDGNVGLDMDYQMRNSPFADYGDEEGNPVQFPLSSEYSQRGYNYDFQKQYLDLEKGYTVLNSILHAKIKLPFNITYTFNASPRYQFFYDRYFMSAELPGSDPKGRGANREQSKRFDWSLNNTITWDQTFNDKHHIVLTLVQEAEERKFWSDRIEARNILPSDALGFHNTKNGSKEDSSFMSNDSHQTADALLARLFYSYNDRYMLTTSIRRDGYSAFGTSNPYATFPSIATAWTFTNEKFFKWGHIMNHGKLRISYGENGNRSLANPYLALANLSEGAGRMHGYINSSGELELYRYLMADRLANPNLQWEKTASWNFGLDFGFLNGRISGSIEYYDMSTHDMIMNQRLPSFTGFKNITTNLGQVDNRGVEVALNTTNISKENFEWSTTFSFSYNKNKIRHLYYQYEDVLDAEGNIVGSKEMDDISNGWFIGKSIGAIWDYRVTGIWQADEVEEAAKYGQLPGDPKVANNYTADDIVNDDGSVTHVYNDKDKEFLGETTPPVHWSLRNDFVLWKDLSFSFNIYSYMGHKSLSGNYLNNDDLGGRMAYALQNVPAKEYWTPDNPTNEFGRIEASGPTGAAGAAKLYDRSFIRLENISVGYTFPEQWTSSWGINRVKVYGSVRNAAVWAKEWPYGDPETYHGRDNPAGWATSVYTLGLNFTF
ncbi:SusC/RagA family TonB-linked outer membrane protein [Sinomicrobium weinanense]|uniref:SusC/RagA family TonB-linked outer membrane protein n=1 Tax=Sinomicrobium weinanense TaxID=2842200 RepID=A0A926JSG8_9FLAO|nr:SusC/RagA family TonB-linked outer membrane protein [Sinomicrobium weinanense]MBC9796484.1 SusC/RagA family TonB-linked outer membrane protein [Sinomicrobium weinanense]MBU3125919.1 SusC/RagA family TonB-linked outer membrane protein [Sinomicrobium weinanense]